MRIALGRTRMCGKVEESILRRSLGRSPYFNRSLIQYSARSVMQRKQHTFAINSLFLNSPFTRVTFPFLSNSVHRSRGSFVAFAARPRPIVKPPSVPSSISAGRRGCAYPLRSCYASDRGVCAGVDGSWWKRIASTVRLIRGKLKMSVPLGRHRARVEAANCYDFLPRG